MKFKSDKGVAGLTILLSIIVTLFVIGLLVMVFTIMSNKLSDATYTSTTTSFTNQSVTFPSTNAVQTLTGSTYRNAVCNAISYIANATTTGVQLTAGNVTHTGCTLTNATALTTAYGRNGTVYVTYTVTWEDTNTGTKAINDTATSIASVTDWFDIFIVITAMVVLVLLVVIIITSIRSSGLVAGGSTGANKVGTA